MMPGKERGEKSGNFSMKTKMSLKEETKKAKRLLRKDLPLTLWLSVRSHCAACVPCVKAVMRHLESSLWEEKGREGTTPQNGGTEKGAEMGIAMRLGPKGTQGDMSCTWPFQGTLTYWEMLDLLDAYIDGHLNHLSPI